VNQNNPAVLEKLAWMEAEGIWPKGLRYLWTDAFGLVLLVSLYQELQDERYLAEAEELVAEVERVLGRPRGLRIGEAEDRDGQYFHYLAMWLFALGRLGQVKSTYSDKAIDRCGRFIRPSSGRGWRGLEDAGGFERSLSWLRPWAPGPFSRLRGLPPSRSKGTGGGNSGDGGVGGAKLSFLICGPGPWAADDALVQPFFPGGALGLGAAPAQPGHLGADVDRVAGLLLPPSASPPDEIRLHQLRSLPGAPGRGGTPGASPAPQRVFFRLSLRR
jgi:hypothetical protein